MATRLINGLFREVWRELVPLNGGASQTILTGIAAYTPQLGNVRGSLHVITAVGVPSLTVSCAVSGGFIAVTVTNGAAPGNTATFTLDVMLTHTIQQAFDASASAYIPVTPSQLGGAVSGGVTLVPTTPAPGDYPYVISSTVQLLEVSNTAADRTVTLPSAAAAANKLLPIVDTSGGAAIHNITIQRAGADLINGSLTQWKITTNYGTAWLWSNGTGWFVVA